MLFSTELDDSQREKRRLPVTHFGIGGGDMTRVPLTRKKRLVRRSEGIEIKWIEDSPEERMKNLSPTRNVIDNNEEKQQTFVV